MLLHSFPQAHKRADLPLAALALAAAGCRRRPQVGGDPPPSILSLAQIRRFAWRTGLGTRSARFQAKTTVVAGKPLTYESISVMDQYANKCFEELRYEDLSNAPASPASAAAGVSFLACYTLGAPCMHWCCCSSHTPPALASTPSPPPSFLHLTGNAFRGTASTAGGTAAAKDLALSAGSPTLLQLHPGFGSGNSAFSKPATGFGAAGAAGGFSTGNAFGGAGVVGC
jgi:hypothetical protein